MNPSLTHVALHVKNLPAIARFYTDYCGMREVRSHGEGAERVIWLAEPGQENRFVIVVIPNGPGQQVAERDFSHLGFACASREEVDAIAARAERDGCLLWPPREEPWPVGYYCGLRDPDGRSVEFSHGQPLGD